MAAGFGYHFNALKKVGEMKDLSSMFVNTLDAEGNAVAVRNLQGMFPLLRLLVSSCALTRKVSE